MTRATARGCSMNSMCGAPGSPQSVRPQSARRSPQRFRAAKTSSISPARQSVGTWIAPSRALVSIAAMARQACAHAIDVIGQQTIPRGIRRAACAEFRGEPAVKCCIKHDADALTLRCAPRSAAITRFSSFRVDGQAQIARALTSFGYLSARCCATMPPKEKPATAAGANPRAPSNTCTSSA